MRNPSLNIQTTSHLSKRIGISEDYLIEIAKSAKRLYREWCVEKKGGKSRPLCSPSECLLNIQKRIYENLLKPLRLSDSLYGGVKGRSVLDNVKNHVGKECILVVDIKNFFPSISRKRVYNLFNIHLKCSPKVSGILSDLTIFRKKLPQGASTSPNIANLVSHFCILPELNSLCNKEGFILTMYIDDIAISSNDSKLIRFQGKIAKIVQSSGFEVHPLGTRGKNEILTQARRMTVNGLVVNKKANVSRDYIKLIRARIHQFRQNSNSKTSKERMRDMRSIKGQIAHVLQVNPCAGARLLKQLEI